SQDYQELSSAFTTQKGPGMLGVDGIRLIWSDIGQLAIIKEMQKSIHELERQMGHMDSLYHARPEGAIPSDTEKNPKHMMAISLRSGKGNRVLELNSIKEVKRLKKMVKLQASIRAVLCFRDKIQRNCTR
ncbi:hypothetical protein HAX54_004972, partial [Datura stramonium]|nr:hypothetical protein [Datura stramonium]